MKPSGPVFTRQNPFQPGSRVGKTHNQTSRNQSQTRKKKKTALSPVRLNQRSTPQIHSQQPYDKHDNHFTATDRHPVYAESWPSTDGEGSPGSSINLFDMEIPRQSARAGKSTVSFELGDQEDSVLAKYIERFRHGRPQSREERQLVAPTTGEEQLPFWWMSPSALPPSSTPTKTTDEDVMQPLRDDRGPGIFSADVQNQSDRPISPCRGSLSGFLDTSQGDFDDTEIQHLQERASRLLLRGECTLSDGSIPISSEGLGCSEFSSPVSADEPVQRPLIPSLIKSTTDSVLAVTSQKSFMTPTRPEDDILFQWRLRRKMEQARERPLSIRHSSHPGPNFSWYTPSLHQPSASEQAYKQQQSGQPPEFSQKATHPHITSPQTEPKEAHGPCHSASNSPPFHNVFVSGSSVSQPQTIAHVPAHMHLLCDVLPCPIQSSKARGQQSISLTSDEYRAKVESKKSKVTGNSSEEPALEHVSSSPPASTGTIEGQLSSHVKKNERHRKDKTHTKESERIEKKTAASIRQHRKSTRYSLHSEHSDRHSSTNTSSHQRLSRKVIPWTEHHQQQGRQEFSSESCTGDDAPPSPIHSALGQVVSEVLFSTVDSSPAEKIPISLVSPPKPACAPLQSPVPPCSAQNSVEVISQLLQEAEDSDEKEFEDDPLLQVLRKQRKWVKEQISEVDSMLNEFLDAQQVT